MRWRHRLLHKGPREKELWRKINWFKYANKRRQSLTDERFNMKWRSWEQRESFSLKRLSEDQTFRNSYVISTNRTGSNIFDALCKILKSALRLPLIYLIYNNNKISNIINSHKILTYIFTHIYFAKHVSVCIINYNMYIEQLYLYFIFIFFLNRINYFVFWFWIIKYN